MQAQFVTKKRLAAALLGVTLSLILGCATVKGTVMGAGVGYVLGDAQMGAAIGATAGLIKDIWD